MMVKVKRKPRQWTQEEIKKAKQMYSEGMNMSEIGRVLNRPSVSVRLKLQALEIHKVEKVYLWDIKSIRGHIINIDEAKETTHKSSKKLLFKCSTIDCDNTKMMVVHNLVNRGYSCNICSTGTSYPELFMLAYLTVKNIPHETQVSYEEIPTRRFDFRIKLNGVTSLVETHGSQHFLTEEKTYHKVETIQESDSIKRQYAKDNKINYIELDCRESTFEFIRNQIELNEHLPNVEESEIDAMLKIMEQNKKYPVKEIVDMYLQARKTTYQIAEYFNYDAVTIGNILTRNNVELRDKNTSKAKKIRCIETGIVYASTHEAGRKLEIHQGSISQCCKGNRKSAGGFTFEYLTAAEENAHHRASLVSQQDKLDTIELDSSDHMLNLFNKNKEKV